MKKPVALSPLPDLPETRTHRSFAPILGFEVYQLLAVGVVLLLILPFWVAAVLAFITACGLQPVIRVLEKKLQAKRGNYAFVIVSMLCGIMVGMTGYTAVRVARLTVDFAATGEKKEAPKEQTGDGAQDTDPKVGKASVSLNEMKLKVKVLTSKWAPSYNKDVETFLNTLPKNFVNWLAVHAQEFVSNTFEILTQMTFYFLFLFIFLSKGRTAFFALLRKKRDSQPRITLWYEMIETASFTSVVSTASIGLIQATIVTVACGFLGYSEWGLLFFGCFILSFVPVLGPASIPFVLALSSFVEGDTSQALWLGGLSAFAGTIDNVLRPLMVSAENDINPLMSFIAMVGAISIFGFPGLLLGPFLVTLSALLLSEKSKEGFRPL